jgi:DNA/RNA-binding domain of Phe-tRNA-synthetase-like protein
MPTFDKQFIVHPEISTIGLKGIYLTIEYITNKENDLDFQSYQKPILDQAYTYASQHDLKEDPILQGFRHLHEAVGAPNRKNLSAPENLYKLLVKNGGNIPHINLLVDIYNTISVKYKLALGAHDLDKIDRNIHLKFTDGAETYQPIGESPNKPIAAGQYSYIDESNEIICYLDVRQVKKTAVNEDTTSVFFVVQGNSNTPIDYIRKATAELVEQVKKYCGGKEKIIGIVD